MATSRADEFLAQFEEQPQEKPGVNSKADDFLEQFEEKEPAPVKKASKADDFLSQFEPEQPTELPEEIGFGRQAASLGAEVVAGEAGRMASTAAGAAIGTAFGGPVGTLVGGAIGFVTGGLATGAAASYGAQKFIEGREEVNQGRVVRDSLINIVPLLGKATKGTKLASRVFQSGAKHGLVGGGIGAGGHTVQTLYNEGELPTVHELAAPTLLGVGLGAGLGVTAEFAAKSYKKYAGMTQDEMSDAIMRGDPEAIALTNAVNESNTKIAERAAMSPLKRTVESLKDLTARQIPSWRLGGNLSRTVGDFNDSQARGQAHVLSKTIDSALKAKTLAKEVTVSQQISKEGFRITGIGEDVVLMPGEVLKKGTRKHDALVTWTAANIIEGKAFDDLVTGARFDKAFVGTTPKGDQILRWDKAPEWLGDDAMKTFGNAKRAFRQSAQGMLDLHQAGIRPLTDELKEKLARSINEDSYLPRVYRFFTEDTYKPSERATNKLKEHLKKKYEYTDDNVKDFLLELNRKRADDPIDAMNSLMGGKVGTMDVFKKRSFKGDETDRVFREYLGEVLNPGERLGEGFMQVQKYIGEARASVKMAENLIMTGQAKVKSQITEEDFAQGIYVPLRVGGVEVKADGITMMGAKKGEPGIAVPNKPRAVMAGGGTKLSKAQKFGKQPKDDTILVTKEFQQAINQATGDGVKSITQSIAMNPFGKKFMQMIALSKFVKVPLNPPSYMIQGYGSMVSTFTNGFNPLNVRLLGKSGRIIRYSANPKPKNLLDAAKGLGVEKLLEMQRRGLIDRNTLSRDMNELLGSAEKGATAFQKGFQYVSDKYSLQDDLWRIANFFEHEKLVGRAVNTPLKGLSAGDAQKFGLKGGKLFSDEEVASTAQFFTRQFYQNYPQLNKILRDLSQLGALGQFASFGLELARNYTNKFSAAISFSNGRFVKGVLQQKQVDLIAKGMPPEKAAELVAQVAPQMTNTFRKHGAKMLAAQATAFGGTIAAINAWNSSHGIDEETESAMREIVYPWDRNSNLAFEFDAKNRNMKWKNVSYLFETATHTNIVQSIGRGETATERMMNVFSAMIDPIKGEGLPFVLKNFAPAVGNYNPQVRKAISVDANPFVRAMEQAEWYVSETFMPGIIREYDRATSASRDQPIGDTLKRQIGIRWNSRDLDQLVKSRVAEVKQLLNTSRSDLAYDLKRLPANMHEAAYQKHNATYQENFEANIKVANAVAFIEQKFDPTFKRDQAIRVLRDAGMPAKEALFAIKGEVPSLKRTHKETPTEKWDEIYALPKNERRAAINSIEDNNMKRDVMRRYRKNLQDQRTGITEEQKVLRTMRTEERADAIFEMMQQSSNPQTLLNDYRRKRIATPRVLQQIRTLEQAR